MCQVGLTTDSQPRRSYTPDESIVSAAFELTELSTIQKEACCGFDLCECLPSQQRTLFRRAEAVADGTEGLDKDDFCSAYLQLCTRMFTDLDLEAANCKVLFTTVLDRPDACEYPGTSNADNEHHEESTASQMCLPIDSLIATESQWNDEFTKLNQPEPGLIHFTDRAARCMSEVLVEGLGVKAVQCIPPVQVCGVLYAAVCWVLSASRAGCCLLLSALRAVCFVLLPFCSMLSAQLITM